MILHLGKVYTLNSNVICILAYQMEQFNGMSYCNATTTMLFVLV